VTGIRADERCYNPDNVNLRVGGCSVQNAEIIDSDVYLKGLSAKKGEELSLRGKEPGRKKKKRGDC